MPTIVRVGALEGGDKLDIQLSNDSVILLDIKALLRYPRFSALAEDDRVLYPRTDGDTVYWRNGPSLTLDEMIELLKKNSNHKETKKP